MAEASETRVQHLEMVQDVIGRMGQNSFLLKGWSVTLVTALMALAARDSNRTYAWIAIAPAAVFWGLDAYYLRQERLFRALYDWVRSAETSPAERFSMRTERFQRDVARWLSSLVAPTVVGLHGVVSVIVLLVAIGTIPLPQGGGNSWRDGCFLVSISKTTFGAQIKSATAMSWRVPM